MIVGLLKESENEQRIAFLPEIAARLVQQKVRVFVEKDAGLTAFQSNQLYEEAGAEIVSREEVLTKSDLLVQIGEPSPELVEQLGSDKIWLSQYNPLWNKNLVTQFLQKGITSFSMDSIPRTSRAQAMDVLSSMATVSGYKEEVMSLGARFVEVEGAKEDAAAGGYAVEQTEEFKQKQQQAINDHAAKADVVICTAQIPGRKAPVLLPKEAVERMKPGSVIVDLAASSGGNCELTQDNETVVHHGVKIIGQSNYPSMMPVDASKMYGKNVFNFLELLIADDGSLNLNFEDDIVAGTCITHKGEVLNSRVKSLFGELIDI